MSRLPPEPLPENLWGDRWRFAAITAGSLVNAFRDQPIPIVEMPDALLPITLGIASSAAVPGIVIDGGRRSLPLARWLQASRPIAVICIPGNPSGLILEAGESDRWVLATFDDPDVSAAGQQFEQRKQATRGLHFVLVQPDDCGVTYSGIWLLRQGASSINQSIAT